MYRLQLFADADSFQPIDARFLNDGRISIGRDPSVDWSIADPACAISRVHCQLQADRAGLVLTPVGANGVFDDDSGERFDDGVGTPLEVPCTLRIGGFRLVAAEAPQSAIAGDGDMTMMLTPPMGTSLDIPEDWSDATPVIESPTESLLEAFCQGAGFDSSALSAEDPVALMRRAGAVYRQMVLGTSDLMQERDHARGRYRLSRTTIGGSGNNYFKWAPSQRLAIDLLLSDQTTFLSGPEAVRSSFGDIKRHLIATFAGLQASLRQAIDMFAPEAVAAVADDKANLLRSRGAMRLEEMERRHLDLKREIDESDPGVLEAAFVKAYERADDGARLAGQ
jgi:predicted component of type VI protein secretion system